MQIAISCLSSDIAICLVRKVKKKENFFFNENRTMNLVSYFNKHLNEHERPWSPTGLHFFQVETLQNKALWSTAASEFIRYNIKLKQLPKELYTPL